MHGTRAWRGSSEGHLARGAQLLGLFGLAVGQPLLDLIGRYPTFLVAHGFEPADIIVLLAVLLLGPPAAAWAAIAALGLISRTAALAAHRFALGILAATAALIALKGSPIEADALQVLVAGGVGCAVVFGLWRFAWARMYLTALGAAPIVFAVVFLANGSIRKLLAVPEAPRAVHAITLSPKAPPIVMVVFDELPTISLLDAAGEIDPVRYPSFARLAGDSTWFRNTSAVHFMTDSAVPSLLTGRYPQPGLLPITSDHPQNLFSLLGGDYELEIVEVMTHLYDSPETATSFTERVLDALDDLTIVWLHTALPAAFSASLPPVGIAWRSFGGEHDLGTADMDRDAPAATGDEERQQKLEERHRRFENRHGQFMRFVSSIEPSDDPTFHFLHILLPHRPWHYLPSGRSYRPSIDLGLKRGPWAPQEWWTADGYLKHLMQLEWTDSLLGELIAHLEAIDLYDRALIVVLSDHGVGFWPGQNRRFPNMEHPSDVLAVPFFLKAPHQKEPRVSDRNVETIDVLPTIAAVLEIDVPFPIDGCSALSDSCPTRSDKVMYDDDGTAYRFAPDLDLTGASLQRKLRLFGSGRAVTPVSAWGRYGPLVGRPLAELAVGSPSQLEISADRSSFEWARAWPERFAAARIIGRVEVAGEAPARVHLAIAINGRIRAVTVAERGAKGLEFSAFVEEHLFDDSAAELAFYVLEGEPSRATLRPTRATFE